MIRLSSPEIPAGASLRCAGHRSAVFSVICAENKINLALLADTTLSGPLSGWLGTLSAAGKRVCALVVLTPALPEGARRVWQ